jgi:hypothetical protein
LKGVQVVSVFCVTSALCDAATGQGCATPQKSLAVLLVDKPRPWQPLRDTLSETGQGGRESRVPPAVILALGRFRPRVLPQVRQGACPRGARGRGGPAKSLQEQADHLNVVHPRKAPPTSDGGVSDATPRSRTADVWGRWGRGHRWALEGAAQRAAQRGHDCDRPRRRAAQPIEPLAEGMPRATQVGVVPEDCRLGSLDRRICGCFPRVSLDSQNLKVRAQRRGARRGPGRSTRSTCWASSLSRGGGRPPRQRRRSRPRSVCGPVRRGTARRRRRRAAHCRARRMTSESPPSRVGGGASDATRRHVVAGAVGTR